MQLKKVFKRLLGRKDTIAPIIKNEPDVIKYYDSNSIANQGRTFNSNQSTNNTSPINLRVIVPEGQFQHYTLTKKVVKQHAATIAAPEGLDIIVLIKERQEALHHIVNFLRDTVAFPPINQNSVLYKKLCPLIKAGEDAGKVNRSERYGIFNDMQKEIVKFFDGRDDSRAHLLNDQQENQKLLVLLSWIIALKNFAFTKPLEYAGIVDDLAASQDPQQVKLASILVFLAESKWTDDMLKYTGTVRNADYKVMLENAVREWYKGCNLVSM